MYLHVEDELMRELEIMLTIKEIPVCLVFAATLYLAIHKTLRDEVDFSFEILAKMAIFAQVTVRSNLEFRTPLPSLSCARDIGKKNAKVRYRPQGVD
jgi:hypothetical protein